LLIRVVKAIKVVKIYLVNDSNIIEISSFHS